MPEKKITTCLWFDNEAEEAAEYYLSVFGDGRITDVQRYSEAGPGEPGSVVVVAFELFGQRFTALNGGKVDWAFNESVSFQVHCEDQAEVDDLWAKLTADGGQESQCGWLKDRYGVSWQIEPKRLFELLADPDPALVARVTEAMLTMKKIDIPTLEAAAAPPTREA
ncbi:VOC family protein [Streptomyces alkaliterrae]|uniref:VOC family protein n=1 Tax=Streptomyces alkaliterrae TaxID=2213162 RepID=A0A5P0YZ09_9ACTN|nr:VOC family protein [Streptomyces alkaliterrae]MBB1262324.1 VOC family protein [Streptomyces alkaliterrae]MQS05498.1 VOC family protein [Streptomyces alkaliterrae]